MCVIQVTKTIKRTIFQMLVVFRSLILSILFNKCAILTKWPGKPAPPTLLQKNINLWKIYDFN